MTRDEVRKRMDKIKLPKSWGIRDDDSSKVFRNTVIYYLNMKYPIGANFGNAYNEGSIGCWYGVGKDGTPSCHRTTNPEKYFDNIITFYDFFNAMFMSQDEEIYKLKNKLKNKSNKSRKKKK